jgi:hypothetical protein
MFRDFAVDPDLPERLKKLSVPPSHDGMTPWRSGREVVIGTKQERLAKQSKP